jgi:TonB family protein
MQATLETRNKTLATIYTAICLAVFMFIIFWINFVTPIPPFEGSGEPGIEVNFGVTDEGMGTDYSYNTPSNPENNTSRNTDENNDDGESENNEVITSDVNDNNVVVKPDKKKKQEDKKQTEQQPDQNLQNAFNNFNDKSSDGDKNKNGNQGKPEGGDSKNYNGDNKNGNNGDGDKGKGGYGYKTNLKGRLLLTPPEKITSFTEESIIVVEIEVDKNGKVVNAEVNRSKSTNPKYDVCAKARQAAMKMKFNASPDGTIEQKGTVTFEFKLE